MRYYVVREPEYPDLRAHVVAEITDGDELDEVGRRTGRAAPLVTGQAWVATRDELMATPPGRSILDAWMAGDDSQDREQVARWGVEADAEDERWLELAPQEQDAELERIAAARGLPSDVIPSRSQDAAVATVVPIRGSTVPASPPGAFDLFSAMRSWVTFLEASGKSEVTRRLYGRTVLRFFADVLVYPPTVTEDDVAEYLAACGPSVREAALTSLRSFYRWGSRRGIVRHDPTEAFRFHGPKYPPAVALTEEEFRRVVIAAASRHPRRAWAIVLTLETGARIGSMAALEPDDVPTEPGQLIRFRVAKGDRPYAVPLSPLAAEAARELHLLRRSRTLLGVHKNSLWNWYHTAAREALVPPHKWRAHVLRDTFATNLLVRRRVDPRTVQELLNHADLSQMHRYAAVTDENRRAAMSTSSFG